jgi:hypothetical protein
MSEVSKNLGVAGSCQDLDAADVVRVTAFMAEVIRAFALGAAALLEPLSHPSADPRDNRNDREFDQGLMDGGDKVTSWSARPYTEPNWEIMRTGSITRRRPSGST